MEDQEVYYVLLIDTDSYAGNFEREMCSFITGLNTPRGDDYIRKEENEHTEWWGENITWVPRKWSDFDEECSVMWDSHPDVKETYCSVAMFCMDVIPQSVIDDAMARAHLFPEAYRTARSYMRDTKPIKILGYRLLRVTMTLKVEEEEIT